MPSTPAAAPTAARIRNLDRVHGVPMPVPRIFWGWLLALASLRLVLHAAMGSGYGFQLDELHFLACGRRLQWAYVDHPALVPWLAHLAQGLFGANLSPFELRWFSAGAGALVVLLAGLMAREGGGGRYAQATAAFLVLTMPLFVSTGEQFQTTVFDQGFWALTLWLTLWTLRSNERRGWLLVGLAAGLGLETKLTMELLGFALAVALVATPAGRAALRTPWPWLGGALAVALLLPNLWWQGTHGWPGPECMRNNARNSHLSWSVPTFVLSQVGFVGPVAVPLLLAGLWGACRRGAAAPWRVVAIVAGVTTGVLLALRGKPYYLGPVYPALAALSAVTLETWARRRGFGSGATGWRQAVRPALAGAVALGALPLLPAALPLVPLDELPGSRALRLNPDLASQVGWPQLAAQVAATVDKLPAAEQARACVLCVSFVEAAAIEQFQPGLTARVPVVSPHNTFWFWGPGEREPDTIILVGTRPSACLLGLCRERRRGQRVATPFGISNAPSGRYIYVCRHPKLPLPVVWPLLQTFG